MKKMTAVAAAALLLSAVSYAQDKIVLRLMGDSTMADKELSYENPERGWGQRLKSHLDTNVTVVNYAQNGRSTKSFRTLGLWDRVKSDLNAGDWLFIQFGHNDSKESDTTRYAAPFGAYMDNLRVFVEFALDKGAHPVLFTPVSRRWFDGEGKLKTACHGDYPAAAEQVAREYGIPFIDANSVTQAWLSGIGDVPSRKYYMWVEKGTNPRHPDGLCDNTHTNAAGARKLVELLLPEIVKAVPVLASHVVEYDFVVAKDGSGDFFTVQDAVNAAPDYCRHGGITIYIKDGRYEEKVVVPPCKQRLHLIGQSACGTVVTWSDYAKKKDVTGHEMGTSATSSLFVYADDFLAENLTIENSAGEGPDIGQACAVTVDADRVAFINCLFLANQDTIYTYGKHQKQYFRGCLIEGTTDFIFGASTCWFEDCTIVSKKNSYITAASTPEGEEFGYVFHNCRLVHTPGVDGVWLGRPWRPFAKTVFICCELSDHIRKEGWHNWNKPYSEKTVFYAEYGNTGAGAVGKKERVKWAHFLKPSDLKRYTPENVLRCGAETDKHGNLVQTEWFFKVF
ncbi:MAG: pectin esterase [Bacteroidales bacterium]|nr:pectin esterase [Bacteroidales bacterium]